MMKKLCLTLGILFTSISFANSSSLEVSGNFDVPESILHLEQEDVYLVSNMGGISHSTKDNNGFISKVSPDGKIIDEKWIAGGKNNVELHAPTGMLEHNQNLWVVDHKEVKIFDLKTANLVKTIKIPEAKCLNDIAKPEGDIVYITDCGFNDNFEPTGTDAIFKIDVNSYEVSKHQSKNISHPNGITVGSDGKLYWLNMFPGSIVSAEDDKIISTTEQGGLDGIVQIKDHHFYVSSWETGCVLEIVSSQSTCVPETMGVADISLDKKRNRLLLPFLNENRLKFISLD